MTDGSNSKQFRVPPLQGRHVFLRALSPDDFQYLRLVETSTELAVRWRYRGATPSPEEWAHATWDEVLAQFMIIGKREGAPIGLVTTTNVNFQDGYAWCAATRLDAHRRSPLLMFGLALFLEYVFACWDLRKLYMHVPEYNYGQFASGLGRYFEIEGRLRGHYYFHGERWDQLILAVYRDSWQANGAPLVTAAVGA